MLDGFHFFFYFLESQSDEDSGTQQPFDLRTQMSILRGNTKLEDENGTMILKQIILIV